MPDIRITIFDDNADIRNALALLFNTQPGFVLAGSFSHARNVEEMVEATIPDVVLMDIDMPEVNGIEAVKQLRKKFQSLHIVMLTIFNNDDKIFDAICAGANGYILKTKTFEDVIVSVHEVVAGGSPMSPSIATKVLHLFQKMNAPVDDDVYNLTKREKEVLQLLAKGDSYKMIAAFLKIAYPTVNTYITSIYRKLHVHSLGEAISKALHNKIV
jgi:DNA-binding NarL/FixJ family response regulator